MKHKLKLEELAVDSFQTVDAAREEARGTVHGFARPTRETCNDPTCGGLVWTCIDSCQETCGLSCGGTCVDTCLCG